MPFTIARDSDGKLTASGIYSVAGSNTTTWSGASDLTARSAGPNAHNVIDGIGEIDSENKLLRIAFFVSADVGMTVHVDSPVYEGPVLAVWAYGDGPLSSTNALPAIYMPLDQNFGILSDERALEGGFEKLKWGYIVPDYIPDDATPR